jgi:hypothetical protein
MRISDHLGERMPALVVFELQDMLSKAQDVTEHKGAAMYSRRGRTSKVLVHVCASGPEFEIKSFT